MGGGCTFWLKEDGGQGWKLAVSLSVDLLVESVYSHIFNSVVLNTGSHWVSFFFLLQDNKNEPTPLGSNGTQPATLPRPDASSQSKKQSAPAPLEFVTQNPLQARYAMCKLQLKNLVHHKREQNAAG